LKFIHTLRCLLGGGNISEEISRLRGLKSHLVIPLG
jgi:hypothetical protein